MFALPKLLALPIMITLVVPPIMAVAAVAEALRTLMMLTLTFTTSVLCLWRALKSTATRLLALAVTVPRHYQGLSVQNSKGKKHASCRTKLAYELRWDSYLLLLLIPVGTGRILTTELILRPYFVLKKTTGYQRLSAE